MLPLITMYDVIALDQVSLDLQQTRSYFNLDYWEQLNTTTQALTYLEQSYVPKYFGRGFRSPHIPLSKLIIAQQRSAPVDCNGTFIECNYQNSGSTVPVQIPNESCVENECGEFQHRSELFGVGTPEYELNGHYEYYDEFAYYMVLNINGNVTDLFNRIKNSGWISNHTKAIAIFGSYYVLKSKQQVVITLLAELSSQEQTLYQSEIIHQLEFSDVNDQVHLTLFSIFVVISLLKIFRSMLELTYIFSRFNLLFQIYQISSLMLYIIVHVQILIIRNSQVDNNMIFTQSLLSDYIPGRVMSIGTSFQLNDLQTIEDVGKLLLWLSYPYTFLAFSLIFINIDWVQSYYCLVMRTLPGIWLACTLATLVYLTTFFPQFLLDIQYRVTHHSNQYSTYLFTRLFLNSSQDTNEQPTVFAMVIECFQHILYMLIAIYVFAISVESFRKASYLEMPYQSKYDKDLGTNIEGLTIKITKILKLVLKLFVKDTQAIKKKHEPNNADPHSQILDDELLSEVYISKPDKILTVFEIQNSFLEEIALHKARKENNLHFRRKKQPAMVQSKEISGHHKVGTIISQLLQKNKQQQGNSKLQVMLSKYQNQDEHMQLNEEPDHDDFFKQYADVIEQSGVTIRSFYILDQVISFLEMLIRLRPEFLSLNAESRIRILFYINSDQVEEEDVYKLLSFLIVNLAKQHLTYPIMVYSQHKDWYIEKDQYLKLKKFYKNIFSTLDKQCALQYCLMKASFNEIQNVYSKQQQFYEKELEDMSNSMIEENDDKSIL